MPSLWARSWVGARRDRLPRLIAAAASGLVVGSLLVAIPAAAQPPTWPVPAPPAAGKTTPVTPISATGSVGTHDSDHPAATGSALWPAGGSASVAVDTGSTGAARAAVATSGAGTGHAGGLGVRVREPGTVGASGSAAQSAGVGGVPGSLTVSVADHATARTAGVDGVLFTLVRGDGSAADSRVALDLDYSSFAGAYGGNYGARLRVVQLPGCVLSTPGRPECQVQTPVAGVSNVPGAQVVSVDSLAVTGDAGSTFTATGGPTDTTTATDSTDTSAGQVPAGKAPKASGSVVGSTPTVADTSSSQVVYALAAGSSSGAGDYAATSLLPSSGWAAGSQGGEFSYTVPLKMPPGLGGPVPDVTFGYSSASTDGRTTSTNPQASWLGEGWDYQPGYIEASYKSCLDDGGSTADLCWYTDSVMTMMFGGHSGRMVKDDTTHLWHAESDDGSRLELLTDTSLGNGDTAGRYWKLTTLDGTQYFFGKNKRYAADTLVTNSVQNVLVYGNNVGEPCYNTAGHPEWSACNMALRWNLDYVVDPRGNSMTYFYSKFQGAYGNWNGTQVHTYDINVTLDHIDYGTRAGSESATAPLKVVFGLGDRCSVAPCTGHPENWPDTPWDQYCATTATTCSTHQSPTFWTRYDLDSVATQRYDPATSAYVNIDKWHTTFGYPTSNEAGVSPSMWLGYLNRTGYQGASSITAPAVHFGGNNHGNLVSSAAPYYNHIRMEEIDSGTGGQTLVTYSPQMCTPSNITGVAWDQNPLRCYPAWSGAAWLYYHKYVVTQVTNNDLVGGSPPETTSYAYSMAGSSTNALWHYDSNDAAPNAKRSWTDFAGYSTVTVTHGATAGQQNITQTLYYRGMNGDVTGTRSYDRVANITDSTGTTVPDGEGLRGTVREQQTLDGTTVQAKTIHIPIAIRTAARYFSWTDPYAAAYSVNEAETDTARLITSTTPSTFDWRKITHQYDATYHLETSSKDYGDTGSTNATNTTTTDDVCTTISYTVPNTTGWLIDYPQQTVTTDCAATPTGNDFLSGSQTFYDGDTTALAQTLQGLATKTTVLTSVSGTTKTWTTQSTTGYDTTNGYGRVTDTYDALNRHTTTAYTPASGGPITATTVTNPAGYQTTVTLDPGRGTPLTTTDPNGQATTEQYDPLGDLVKVFKPHTATGVTYAASTATQTFTDITDTGTPVALTGDEAHTQISLPFAFSFYGTSYSSAWLSTNGLMSFTGQSADSASVPLPDSNLPNAALYPFWDDLQLDSQSHVTTQTTGTAPNRAFTIEYYQAYLYGRSSRISFTITLNENGTIAFNYDAIDTNGIDQGSAATVGIENATGTTATQYAYHQTLLATNKAITFTPSSAPVITQPDIQYDYTFGSDAPTATPTVVTTKTLTAQNTQNLSYTVYDGLMRTRQTQTPSPATGAMVIADTAYNDRGLAAKTSTFYSGLYYGSTPPATPSITLFGFPDTAVDQQTRTTYDQLNRATAVGTWSDNVLQWQTSTAYGGDRATVTPPDGGATVTTTDVLGHTTTLNRYPTSAITGTPETTTYTYDRLDQLKSVTDAAGNQTSYLYDLLGRKYSTTDPDTGTSTTVYDAAGQITSATDGRGTQTSHEYDNLGRETTRWAGPINTGTKSATFVYDTLAKGQLTSSSRWIGTDEYKLTVDGYNDQYQPTGQTVSIPMSQGLLAGSYHTNFGYNVLGQATTTSYPSGGGLSAETVTQGYNQYGMPTTMAGDSDAYVTSTTYGHYGELLQRVYGTSSIAQLTRSYHYQPATMRMDTITSLLPDPAHSGQFLTEQQDSYAYTATGDITRITDGTDGQSQCYLYDGQHRLTDAYTATDTCTAAPSAGAIAGSGKFPYWDSYSFDAAGRRKQDVHRTSATVSTTRTFTYPATGAAQVHAASLVVYTGATTRTDSMSYDLAGNTAHRTINGTITDFTFNNENQFSAATVHATGGDQQTTAIYDPNGGLLIRKDPTGTTLYAAGQEYKLAAGTITATRYYSHGGATVAVRTSAGKQWLAADHQGSADLTINATTAAVQRRWYTPYGADRATQGIWPTDRGFLDKQTNTSTGLVDDGAREYDPNLGLFISPDPLTNPGDPTTYNAYAYAGHNPITASDPTGLCEHLEDYDGPCVSQLNTPSGEARLARVENHQRAIDRSWRRYHRRHPTGTGSSGCHMKGCANNYSPADGSHTVCGGHSGGCYQASDNTLGPSDDPLGGVGTVGLMNSGQCSDDNGGYSCLVSGLLDALMILTAAGSALLDVVAIPADPYLVPAEGVVLAEEDTVENAENDSVVIGGGRGSGCSFQAGTKVLLADGTSKDINLIAVGDTVLASDPQRATTANQTVAATIIHHDTELTDVTITDDHGSTSVIHTTPNHLVWDDTNHAWTPFSATHPGDHLATTTGQAVVTNVVTHSGSDNMYNLTITNLHTYYVIAGTTPILVHNAPCNPALGPAYLSDERWSHIVDGHMPEGNPEAGDGVFLGTEAQVKDRIFQTIQRGRPMANTDGRPGETYTVDFNGYEVGYKIDSSGRRFDLYFYTVVVNDGRIVTAYPH